MGTVSQMKGMPSQPDEFPICARPYLFKMYSDEGYPLMDLCVSDLLGTVGGLNSESPAVVLLANDESGAKFPIRCLTPVEPWSRRGDFFMAA